MVTKAQLKKKEETRNSTVYVRQIPDALKHNFKVWCAQRGISLREGIETLLREKLEGEKGKETSK